MCQLLGHRNSVWITSPCDISFWASVSFPCPVRFSYPPFPTGLVTLPENPPSTAKATPFANLQDQLARLWGKFHGFQIDWGSLVGGFNLFEKYQSNWIISPNRGENKKYLKPPPSSVFCSPNEHLPLVSNRSMFGAGEASKAAMIKIEVRCQAWSTNRLEHFLGVFENPVICGTGVSEVYLIFVFFFYGVPLFWIFFLPDHQENTNSMLKNLQKISTHNTSKCNGL